MDAAQTTLTMANNLDLVKSLDLSGEEILYLPNYGNAGDSLIALATYQVLERLGIRYRIITPETDCAGRTVVFGGGGAFTSRLGGYAQSVTRFHPQAKRLIILPNTVEGHADLLAGLGSHVVIVCREPVSLRHVQQHAPRATILLGHDLALDLDLEMALTPRPWPVLKGMAARLVAPWVTRREAPFLFWAPLRRLRVQAWARRNAGRTSPVQLDVFRGDGERTEERGGVGNLDLSRLLAFGTNNELSAFYSSFSLLGTLAEVEVIRTNRLHVAIAGGLLGKQVEFFPNNYYKNEAVYWHSLKSRWPYVRWQGGKPSWADSAAS